MIPVFSLVRQNKELEEEFRKIFQEFLHRGIAILGPKVEEFETKFAEYLGVSHAVGVASGTDAITLALLALGIGRGDEVIMPANCYPSVFGVAQSEATPRLVDIDPDMHTLDPQQIERAITKKTKAILPVHLYGNPADMERIMKVAKKYKIAVVEDAAQAVGAEINVDKLLKKLKGLTENKKRVRHLGGGPDHIGDSPDGGGIWKKAGSIGDVGCFSFYPTKNLGALGDGGMVVTNNPEIAEKVRFLRMYGERKRYYSVMIGKNSRLDELQSAILLCKMKYLEKWNERRREIAKKYNFQFSIFNFQLKTQKEISDGKNVYHLFVVRTEKRNQLMAYLEKKGIQTAIHYPVPIHLVESFKHLGYKKGDFPESERASKEVLSLPMFPELKDREVREVVREIQSFWEEK